MSPAADAPELVQGPCTFDDAGAVRAANGRIHLHTVDFFPPLLDDEKLYGAIAAANALSDIYAMGGEPKTVLNVAGYPPDWSAGRVAAIVEGAVETVVQSGALWVGGHTVRSAEPLFGFSVFGEVDEESMVRNQGALPGDQLYLSKPLGASPLLTAARKQLASDADLRAAAETMARLNRTARDAMQAAGVKAATDVTGFGLLGHAGNLAKGSEVTLSLRAVALPLYEGAAEAAAAGCLSGGVARGKEALRNLVKAESALPSWLVDLTYDAETSGGILAAVPEASVDAYVAAFHDEPAPVWIGEVLEGPAAVRLS